MVYDNTLDIWKYYILMASRLLSSIKWLIKGLLHCWSWRMKIPHMNVLFLLLLLLLFFFSDSHECHAGANQFYNGYESTYLQQPHKANNSSLSSFVINVLILSTRSRTLPCPNHWIRFSIVWIVESWWRKRQY